MKELTFTTKGLKEVNIDWNSGRMHKIKRLRIRVRGKWYERHILLRSAEKKVTKDKFTGRKKGVHNWGVAMKKEGRKVITEYDVVLFQGEVIPTEELGVK